MAVHRPENKEADRQVTAVFRSPEVRVQTGRQWLSTPQTRKQGGRQEGYSYIPQTRREDGGLAGKNCSADLLHKAPVAFAIYIRSVDQHTVEQTAICGQDKASRQAACRQVLERQAE
jgi:hypothetical protein